MSSVGQAVGGLVGGVIGFFVGGPTGAYYGAQAGMMIGGAIDPPKGPTINGPRLDDLSVQTSTYGAPIPRNYGTIAQTGNVFWLQGDKYTEIETVTESGGKGGPVTTSRAWSYYATFAVGLCQGPIDGVRRIWIGGQLWYDAGADDLASIIASNAVSTEFTLYSGTDTQSPDPLIQADKGVANTPAYRGLAYIVFDTLPLEKYSNSLLGAQVKVEIIKDGSVLGPRLLGEADISAYPLDYYPRPTQSLIDGVMRIYAYDNTAAYTTVAGVRIPNDETILVIDCAGNFIGNEAVPTNAVRPQIVSSGLETIEIGKLRNSQVWWTEYSSTLTYPIQNGLRKTLPYGLIQGINTAGVYGSIADIGDYLTGEAGRYIKGAAVSVDGSAILILTSPVPLTASTTADRYFILDADLNILHSGATSSSSVGVWNIGTSITQTEGGMVFDYASLSGWTSNPVSLNSIRTRYFYVDAAGVLQIGSEITSALSSLNYLSVSYADGIFYVVARTATVARIYQYTAFPTTSWNSAQLSDIVSAECLQSGILTAPDLDVTDLTDTVRGYRVSQLGAIRGALDPLRAAFPFDVVQHGYQIKFVRRGGASVASIPTTALDARAAGASPGVQVTDAREMDLMLPRKVSVNYVDVTREYETNQQSYERINTDAIGERAVDLPIVFSAAEAAQTAEMLTYLYWMERHDVAFVLPPEYDDLEPADVITLTGTDATWELRLLSTNTLPDGRIECRAKYNKAAIYTPVARGEEGQSTGGLLTLAGPCVYSLLDIPLMRDDDDTAGFPVAMAGYLSGWPGGVLYRSDDSGQTWTDLRAFAPGAVMGGASTSLAAHGGTVYDFSSTLSARLYSGTLSSVTEAQLFAGQNWFAYGADGRWEIMAARTATLQGDGSYILQDLLRGQHGTEWATGLHAANDRIILLSAAALSFISVNASSIGSARTYRAITTGKALDSDTDLSFTYTGVNLECLSPVALTGNRHPSTNDWTLTWTRRSRMPGWYDLVDVPLGETVESYEIDIYSDGTYTTVKRTLTAATPTVAYTSAQQVTDFGSNQTTLYTKTYQLSATVGRGYALTQSITR